MALVLDCTLLLGCYSYMQQCHCICFTTRYLQPPSIWIACSLESRELLTLCLKKLKGLNKLHLVDASFIWTEPHSKRLKLKLTVQKEVHNCNVMLFNSVQVLGATLLQQVFVVEFIVHNQICEDCQRRDAKDYWRAVVQVRQKVNELFYLL